LKPRKDTKKKRKIQTEKIEKIKVNKEGYKTRNLSTAERSAIHALVTDGKMNPKRCGKDSSTKHTDVKRAVYSLKNKMF
jgi:hypothetical protein